jgi:nucleotide-binding universal stress UspA family protein
MDKILVGFDGSEGAQQAVLKAKSLVSEHGEIILLVVIPRPEDRLFIDKKIYVQLKKKAHELLAETISEIGNQSYTLTGIVESGDTASTIIDITNKLNCDLIVLGSTGTSKIGRYPLGSVANKVVQYAHKPVMVVR